MHDSLLRMCALALIKVAHRKVLAKVQSCAKADFNDALRSTPQAVLDIILLLLHIDDFVIGMAARRFFRLFKSGLGKSSNIGNTKILQ